MQGATLLTKHCTAESAEQMRGTTLHSAYYLALGAAGALLRCQHVSNSKLDAAHLVLMNAPYQACTKLLPSLPEL